MFERASESDSYARSPEQDEERPLAAEELARVRPLVRRGLAALWHARKGS
jgi:hypothetical protein